MLQGEVMTEHTVIIDTFGGSFVLTCPTLGITNIEFPFKKVDAENVKRTILDYKYLKEEDADFDLVIVDNRPVEENFNEKRARESKQFNKNNNRLI